MFLVPLVVFLGVKFGFQKSCLCKRNDKYEVWRGEAIWDSNLFVKSVTYRPTLSKFRGGQLKKNTFL